MFLCCKILKQRKATGQECAEAHDCPVNAANFKIRRILGDRIDRLAGSVARNRQGLDPTGCTRLAREPVNLCKNVKIFSKG